ncbi:MULTISPECIES: type II secretion system F family protein [Citrobacter]|uniref:Type II secretion system F family protein n=2 Tax=Citrobacter TaxID=544 RepID=A0ABT1B4M1_9ENTR|nr:MULTISPECIES: type II secretion system F family protein [Citrobacter]MDG5474118.1 type II secretion system F family protein [Citrobacter freundii]MBP8541255.1 type II secretion system F family protein [Citrobacter sp. On2M]MBW5271821.1 type II secretion system F family protein [Citrobacter sp. On28M]MCO5780351.1 type II secretion system F family protein [Citrobacter meridianamericanus]MDM2741475.1 type II secretion system F family protein [Citrobacter sp. Cu096]
MSLYVLYFFVVSLFFAFLYLLTKNKKTKKISSVLGRQGNIVAKNEELVSNIEKIYRKTSKTVTFFDFLDSNIFLKFGIVIAFSLLIFILGALGILKYDKQTQAIIIGVALVLVILIPPRIKNYVMKKKTKKINVDLPYVIDIMSICVQSGMTIENALIYISKNIQFINSDIASLLERTAIKIEVSGIVSALDQLYEEVPSAEVRMFCTTLQQSITYGASISTVLVELSKEMREMQLLSVEEKVASLSAKMAAPMILFIMFPILAIVAGPGFIRMMAIWGS